MNNENLFHTTNNKNLDLLHLINNNDAIDLITIQAKKILTDIKRMINIPLNVERTKKIDDDFITSLKKMIVINNNNISDEYLTELSYVYFAAYNNTLDIYYQLKEKDEKLYYWLLDSSLYNNTNENATNYNNKIDWIQYDNETKHTLGLAYEKGVLNDMLRIFEININRSFNSIPDYRLVELFEKENFEKFVNLFSKEIIAKSDIETLLTAVHDDNLEFTKQLIKINPNIIFLKDVVFDSDIKNLFSIEEIAFFTGQMILELDSIFNNVSDSLFSDVVRYYKTIKLFDSKFELKKADVILIKDMFRCSNSTNLAANIFIQLSVEEKAMLEELIDNYLHARAFDVFSGREKQKLRHLVKQLNKNYYGEQKQKKLKR